MILPQKRSWVTIWWQWLVKRWNRTPGSVKWLVGILLGALARLILERFFPERWATISHTFFSPTMPIWIAAAGVIAILVLERSIPALYRHLRGYSERMRLRSLFGVRWAVPPDVERVQGPYCTACTTPLRGMLWSGDASPTLWMCPNCQREFSTPQFPDIRREVERQFGVTRQLQDSAAP